MPRQTARDDLDLMPEVRLWVDVKYRDRDRDHGSAFGHRTVFGPFLNPDHAEECLVVLASRDDVTSATIRNPDGGE
jgi:hypothetical protein